MTYRDEYKSQSDSKLLKERMNTYCREVTDFMRTGDSLILRRILFRNFIHAPTDDQFLVDKAKAVMLIMSSDQSINMSLNII